MGTFAVVYDLWPAYSFSPLFSLEMVTLTTQGFSK